MNTRARVNGEGTVDEETEGSVVRVGEGGSVDGNGGSSRSGGVDPEFLSSVGSGDDTGGDTVSNVPLRRESRSLGSNDDGSVAVHWCLVFEFKLSKDFTNSGSDPGATVYSERPDSR